MVTVDLHNQAEAAFSALVKLRLLVARWEGEFKSFWNFGYALEIGEKLYQRSVQQIALFTRVLLMYL